MTDLDYIEEFKKIKITTICKKLKIDRANFYNRKKPEHLKLVREEIEKEIKELIDESKRENTL